MANLTSYTITVDLVSPWEPDDVEGWAMVSLGKYFEWVRIVSVEVKS